MSKRTDTYTKDEKSNTVTETRRYDYTDGSFDKYTETRPLNGVGKTTQSHESGKNKK